MTVSDPGPAAGDETAGPTQTGAADPLAWAVTREGRPATLSLSETGLALEAGRGRNDWSWAELVAVRFPTSYSCEVTARDEPPIPLGFRDRHHRREFQDALHQVLPPDAAGVEAVEVALSPVLTGPSEEAIQAIAVVTLGEVPGRAVVAVHGLVTGHAVVSRNALSDKGADLKSVVGGRLAGIEPAIDRAIAEADRRIRLAATARGADTVLATQVGLASVSDKAQAVIISGTAVTTRPADEDAPA